MFKYYIIQSDPFLDLPSNPLNPLNGDVSESPLNMGEGGQTAPPENISKCFPIYIWRAYCNMYKHAKNQAHISKIHCDIEI